MDRARWRDRAGWIDTASSRGGAGCANSSGFNNSELVEADFLPVRQDHASVTAARTPPTMEITTSVRAR